MHEAFEKMTNNLVDRVMFSYARSLSFAIWETGNSSNKARSRRYEYPKCAGSLGVMSVSWTTDPLLASAKTELVKEPRL